MKTFLYRYRLTLRSLLVFGTITGGGISFLALPDLSRFLNQTLAGFIAQNTALILNFLGTNASAMGPLVYSGGIISRIVAACTPIYPSIILVASIFAFRASFKHKLLGLSFGIPALFMVNQVRVVNLIYIAKFYPGLLDIAHYLVWQALIIFTAVALWLVWVKKVSAYERA